MSMKGLKSFMVLGIIFVSVLGTLFHFVYEWSGENAFVGLFVPINESIWEHTKLIFFPMLIYSLYLNKKVGREYPCISSAMIMGSILGTVLIIVLYYTYSGIIGYNIAFADISIFYISVIAVFYIAYKATISCKAENFKTFLEILQIVAIALFIILTLFPPDIPLFIDPRNM